MKEFHGLVDPLCGTSWDKWNWDKLHRGYRTCPGTRKGLQRGYMTCPMGQGEEWDRFGTGSLPPGLSHWDKHNLSQSACPTGTGCACPSCLSHGTGLVQAPPFQSRSWTKFRVLSNTKGVLLEFRKFLIKNRHQIGQKSTLKIDFFHFFNNILNLLPTPSVVRASTL